MDFTLTQQEYESLIQLARKGAAGDQAKLTQLDEWLRLIEKKNGVTRYFVMVQWQELDMELPAGVRFPYTWPPELRKTIELISRPIARSDVQQVLDHYATQPTAVLVTKDPAGIAGWKTLDEFFIT